MEEPTWEVNTAKPRRRQKTSKGKASKGGCKGTTVFKSSWAKPEESTSANPPTKPDDTPKDVDKPATVAAGGFVMQSMASLLDDYGEFDPHWMDKQPDIPAESTQSTVATNSTAVTTTNRLGQQGKAPLHIDIISFGFRHGVPALRRDGWSQTHPLVPFDCRESLPPVPDYLQSHDGLSSGLVKRFLLYEFRRQAYQNTQRAKKEAEKDETLENAMDSFVSVREYGAETVAPQIFQALLEALQNGDYGYASPLKIQFYIGSEWGRHRSVVAVEQTAIALRTLLRNCSDNDKTISCPCSVATVHRDLGRKGNFTRDRED